LNEIVQQCVRIEQGITRITTTREDYLNTSYSRREFKREDHPSKPRYERLHEEERERKIEKSLSKAEPVMRIKQMLLIGGMVNDQNT